MNNVHLKITYISRRLHLEYTEIKITADLKNTNKKYNQVIRTDRSSIPFIPLSYSQERLWFIDQMEGSVQYHIPAVLRLTGKLNKIALAKSLKEIVNRHEVLRTVFVEDNEEARQVIQEIEKWELEEAKESSYKDNDNKEALNKFIEQKVKKPFNLSKDFMFRATLLPLVTEEHLLIVTMHHIASDGWSMPILIKEVTSLYRSYSENKPINLAQLDIQYADYAIWQRNYLKGEVLDKKLSYWKEKLMGLTPLELPIDYTRPSIQSTHGASLKFNISKELSDQLQQLSQLEGTTIFMTLLAGLNVLLYRYTGQPDICVGTPVANRLQKEVEGLIGFFVNTLALRNEVNSEQSFRELLQQVRTAMIEAYEHQEVPFEKVVEAIVKERDLSRTPLFQVMLVLQNTPEAPKIELSGLQLSGDSVVSNTSKFELTFSINETPSGMKGSVDYNTDLFSVETIERMVEHFKMVLTSIVKTPGEKICRLKMLSEAEENQLLFDFNNTSVDYPRNKSIIDVFEKQAEKTPDAVAVIFEEDHVSYKELNQRANQVARYLKSKGVIEETLTPICIERSADMIIGILAILKAGGAYVPIDPQYPQERIDFIFNHIITHHRYI